MNFLKVSTLNALSSIVKLMTGFILNKFLSIYLGPAKIALTGQFLNYLNIVGSFSNGGIGSGVIKYLSEYEKEEDKQQVISSSFVISLSFSLVFTIITLFFNNYLSILLLKDIRFSYIFNIFSLSIILFAFNSLISCILNGYQEIKKLIYLNIISSIFGAMYSLILVKNFKLDGVLIAYSTSQSIIFLISLFFLFKSKLVNFKKILHSYNRDIILKLLKFSAMNLISVLCVNLTMIFTRIFITNSLSLESAGYWQSMSKLSDMYLSLITTTLVVYYLPKLSSIKDNYELKKEIFNVSKIVLPILAITNIIIYTYRELIIKIVFTDKFLFMSHLFAFQMLGDFFKIVSWLLAFLMVSKAMTKEFIITEIIFSITYIIFIILFVNMYGFVGISYAWFANYLLYAISMIIMFRKILFSKQSFVI